MSRFYVLAIVLVAIFVSGCQTTPTRTSEVEDSKVLIKCTTCGTVFTSKAAAVESMAEHPDHDMVKEGTPLVKCSTCGTVFTSAANMKKHQQEHPDHAIAPLIRCTTCGTEFTSPEAWKDHIKKHPHHKGE